MTDGPAPAPPGHYELRIRGHLEQHWSTWFHGLTLTHDDDGNTTLRGPVADQAELHGLLSRVRDLGIPLISLTTLQAGAAPAPRRPRSTP